MPKFYGSYTVDVPVTADGENRERDVRVVLLEHVVGRCMVEIKPGGLSEVERENTMFKLIEANINLHFAGLRHDDLEPRNVILSLPDAISPSVGSPFGLAPYTNPNLRVCIIDVAMSAVLQIVNEALSWQEYCNP
jgi:tRNA A-37 threonylcarbamoyl transferase component Bud32